MEGDLLTIADYAYDAACQHKKVMLVRELKEWRREDFHVWLTCLIMPSVWPCPVVTSSARHRWTGLAICRSS